jgi:uncharacterized protein
MKIAISSFLYRMWVNGNLQGAKPEQAYFVTCDRSTMTRSDIDNGRLICQIGIAATKPGEFMILSISHQTMRP